MASPLKILLAVLIISALGLLLSHDRIWQVSYRQADPKPVNKLVGVVDEGEKKESGPAYHPVESPPPVESREPGADYEPSFEGQTRIGGVKTTTPYAVELLAEGLGRPWAVISHPDGLLITEKSGFLMLADSDGKNIRKITGLPKVDDGGQGGLLDVALDPDYNDNTIIYWSYSEPLQGGSALAVARGKLDIEKGMVADPQAIFRATKPVRSTKHFGSRLAFADDGNLFVSTGDRGQGVGRHLAQDLSRGFGKIFRITGEGKPAEGNPFIGMQDAMPEVYAYGIRNAQGLAVHPVTRQLWSAEFGPKGGDELNLIQAGKNYGWPIITYGLEYSGRKVGDGIQEMQGMMQPVYYWDPVLSPSGIAFYEGDEIPEWEDNLFLGGLNSNHIARLVIKGNSVAGEERLLSNLSERFRDVEYHKGMLYAITDSGRLYRIRKRG